MATKKWFEAQAKNSVNETDKFLVYDGASSYTVPISTVQGASNLTEEYVELTSDTGEIYRVFVNGDGETKAIKDIAFTANVPNVEDNVNDVYQALIINQMWGGGDLLMGTAVSHSFIELYNLRDKELNLRGLYLWYKSGTSAWEKIELVGIIPPYSSFLIRGAQHNSLFKDDCRLKIDKYDMEFRDSNGALKKFSSEGMSVYISIGEETPATNPPRKLTDVGGATTVQPAYVDLIGCGGVNEETNTVTAYETNYRFGMDKNHACRRVDFYNGGTALDISGYSNGDGDNVVDTEIIDYSTCDVEKYRPRTSEEGNWDMFVSKEPINDNAPNAFVLGFGEADTTRTFTWQSKLTPYGYVRYKESGSNKWNVVKATTNVLQHPDCVVSKHSAIVRDLEYGKSYEYQVGSEGYWGDSATFDVVDKRNEDISILWMSDEQSWTEDEMRAFKNSFHGIANDWHKEEMDDYSFILETGDISQNGRRRSEYYWYFDALQGWNKKIPIMATMGNNDLLNKMYGQCFANFFTNENQWANSVHHYMVGNTEFICLNSNTDYDYVSGYGSLGDYQSTDAFLLAQAQWLDDYLSNRTTTPDWTICYMHLSPFTCVRTKRVQVFVSVFEKHGVDLVLCGHNHLYTRSVPLKTGYPEITEAGEFPPYNTYYNFSSKTVTDYVNEHEAANVEGGTGINHNQDIANGTYYVMCPATSWKTSGKEKHITVFPESIEDGYDVNCNGFTDGRVWWSAAHNMVTLPGYLTININSERILLNFYQVNGAIMQHDYNGTTYPYTPQTEEATLTRTLSDTLTINKSDRA